MASSPQKYLYTLPKAAPKLSKERKKCTKEAFHDDCKIVEYLVQGLE